MTRTMKWHSAIALVVVVFSWNSKAIAATETVRVGVNSAPPFIFTESGANEPVGYSIDLWQRVAQRGELDYEFAIYPSVSEVLAAVERQEVDLGIAAISITAQRETAIDFSHSYYEGGLQIMILTQPRSPLEMFVAYIFSRDVLHSVAIVFGIALVAAHILWWFERCVNPDMFPKSYFAGIWEALWWSLVTATTVGYGDRCPEGFIGRLIAIFWMMTGILLFAYFTATVTAARLEADIQELQDLYGKRVGAVAETTSDLYLRSFPIEVKTFQERELLYRALHEGKVDAVVDDSPMLKFYAARDARVQVVGDRLNRERYGIAFPEGSSYKETIDFIVLELEEEGVITKLERKWFLGDR